MIAMPDPSTFAVLPWRPEEQGVARMFCDVLTPERTPYEGDPRHVLRRARRARAARWASTPSTSAPSSSTSFQGQARHRGARRGRLLRPHDARRRLRRAPRDGAGARAARHPRRVLPPRGRPQPARGRHALRRRAEDGRRLHDLPHHGQGVRDEVRLARDVHAQAALRRERLRHAHAPVALHRTAATPSSTPTTRTSCPTSARRSSPASSRHAREMCSIFAQWVNCYKRLVPGYEAPVYVAWSRRNRSALVRVPLYHPGRRRPRAWSCAAPTPRATRT